VSAFSKNWIELSKKPRLNFRYTVYVAECRFGVSHHLINVFSFFKIFFLASCFFKHSLVARESPLSERPTPTWRPLPTCIRVGAGRFLEVRRKFARILPNLPEKYFKVRDLQNVISKTKSCQFGCHYLQIKACWAPLLLRFSGSCRRFSKILPRIFPRFSSNQNNLFLSAGKKACVWRHYAVEKRPSFLVVCFSWQLPKDSINQIFAGFKHASWFEFSLPANYLGLCPLFCVRAKACLFFILTKSIFANRFQSIA